MRYALPGLNAPADAMNAAAARSVARSATSRWRLAAGSSIAGLLALSLLSSCSGGAGSPAPNVITITNAKCGTGWQHPAPGVQTLQIHNAASSMVEVSLTNAYNGAVFARVEGVGPGTTRPMPVDVGSGSYAFACDGSAYGDRTGPVVQVPGHARGGVGILPVSTSAMLAVTKEAQTYVMDGLANVARQTTALATEIKAGNLAQARVTWLSAHMAWEELGSAYGMFGPYDDEIDGTPFGLPLGVNDPGFTGFYRLEYGLWHGQPASRLTGPASTLNLNVRSLQAAYPGMELTPALTLSDLALRTHEVLENAMQRQLSGQDNFGSGTTLATMAAGIAATQAQLGMLHPLLASRYQNLPQLYSWLGRLQRLVQAQKTSHGWTPVTSLTAGEQEMLNAAAGETVQLLALIPPLFEANPNS
jgi:iron uptake system component EfeO